MGSGRTTPPIFGCVDDQGHYVGEYVVKLKSEVNDGATGLVCELFSSLLAYHFGLLTPAPAIVRIDPDISQIIPKDAPQVATAVQKSAGLNFGSQFVAPGYNTWPIGKMIPFSLRATAVEIFAFDSLIENVDRRYNNPNLLWSGDKLVLIDHDLAFAFLYEIGRHRHPWNLEGLTFLESHVFFRELKGTVVNLGRFTDSLASTSDAAVDEMIGSVPREWGDEHLKRVKLHIMEVKNHSDEFAEQVRRRLA